MNKTFAMVGLVFGTALLFGCEEEKPAVEKQEEAAPAAPAPAEKTPEEIAAEEKAAAEAKKRAEEESAAQNELAENPLTECCRALGKKGFTERSIEYSTAARACGKEMEAGTDLAGAKAAIEKELGGKPLLDECKAK